MSYASELEVFPRWSRFCKPMRCYQEVDTSKESGYQPQIKKVAAIEDVELRAVRANTMFLQWTRANLAENVRRKALQKVAKTRIDLERSKI